MRFCGQVAFPHSVPVKVKAIDNKTSLEKEEEAHVFLPHMVFSRLGEFYPAFFAKTMELENFGKSWNAVEKSCDPKLSHHSMTLEKDWKRKNVPLFVHGDGVEFQSRDSLLTFSFGSLGSSLSSLETNLYLASFPKSSTHAETWAPIWKLLKWSFDSLGKGFHPALDPDGNALEEDSPWYQAGSLCTPRATKPRFGASLRIMSFSPTISSWGTGLRTTHAGNAMRKTFLAKGLQANLLGKAGLQGVDSR